MDGHRSAKRPHSDAQARLAASGYACRISAKDAGSMTADLDSITLENYGMAIPEA